MSSNELTYYGGQAVLEGVMMRGRKAMAVAVRAPSGDIVVHTEPLGRFYAGPFARIPFLRGLLGLWDAFGLGYKSLNFSAQVAERTADAPTDRADTSKGAGPDWGGWLTLGITLVVGIGLFSVLPTSFAYWLELNLGLAYWMTTLIEGTIQIVLLLGYLWLVGRVPEIRRVFGYHGAEHQTIHAFEASAPLTPESAARFPLAHPRCGTAFILTVAVIAIVIFSLVGPLPLPLRIASRLLLVPVVAGIAYEAQRLTARYFGNPLVRLVAQPGLWLQGLTTRTPDPAMLEVAIAAFVAMREAEVEERGA